MTSKKLSASLIDIDDEEEVIEPSKSTIRKSFRRLPTSSLVDKVDDDEDYIWSKDDDNDQEDEGFVSPSHNKRKSSKKLSSKLLDISSDSEMETGCESV